MEREVRKPYCRRLLLKTVKGFCCPSKFIYFDELRLGLDRKEGKRRLKGQVANLVSDLLIFQLVNFIIIFLFID